MDLNRLNEVTDKISSYSQARAAIETSVARAINELRYNGHAVVDLPKGISFNVFKIFAAEYINENWGNSIFSGKLDLQFSPLGDKVSIRNKGGIASTSDSIVTDGVDPRKYINKIKQEGHEVVNGNGLYELAFEDDILQGDTDTDFSNLDEFIDTAVQGGKSNYGLYVIELPDCNFYSLEEFVRHKNYMNDVEEEDITDTITEPDNLDDWIYECTSKGDFYGDHYFQCIYHGHEIELKYDENKWNFFIDGELISDWDHLDEIDDSNKGLSSEIFKGTPFYDYLEGVEGNLLYFKKGTPEHLLRNLDKDILNDYSYEYTSIEPNNDNIVVEVAEHISDAAEGEVSFANVTNDTIFVLCNGHISKRFNSVENANKWINSTFNPSKFTLAKRENGVLTEI